MGQTILDAVLDNCDEEQGCPKDIFDNMKISHDEETGQVDITVTPPEADMGENEEDFERGMADHPTLEMMIHTGRDFEEMVKNMHGCPETIEGGVNVTASTKLAKAIFHALEMQMSHQIPHPMMHTMSSAIRAFTSLSSLSSHSEIRYNTAKLEAAVRDPEESDAQKEMIEQAKAFLPQVLAGVIGEPAVRAAAGLTDYADHFDSILYRGGLPANYEIYMEFENFHVTPVISEFLQLPEEA